MLKVGNCQILRIVGKSAELILKLTLVRTFGSEGAVCVLAGLTTMATRVRASVPAVLRIVRATWNRAYRALMINPPNPFANVFEKPSEPVSGGKV